jgi:arylsulfatase A
MMRLKKNPLLSLIFFCSLFYACEQKEITTPNVIVIFADDLGYADVGCFGAEGFTKPHLDQMADEGALFTDFHVAAHVCTPSRAALLTGRYPQRIGLTRVLFPWSKDGLAPEELTIAEVLQEEGYNTTCIGKWHLGHKPEFLPTSQGFDSYFGIPYSNDMSQDGEVPVSAEVKFNNGYTLEDYLSFQGDSMSKENYRRWVPNVPLMRDTLVVEWPVDQSTLTQRYTSEAISFVKEQRDKPFFLYLAHTMPHIPLYVSDQFKGTSKKGIYGDVIQEIDWSVGQILQTLRNEGVDRQTLVIFTSDNGPWLLFGEEGGSALPLRDGKGSSYEGGQRVPCIMWWPGTIPGNYVCDQFASTMDILPTVAGLAKAELPEKLILDGYDILPLMVNEEGALSPYDHFIYHGNEAVRSGAWKYRFGPEHGMWAFPPSEQEGKDLSKAKKEQLFNLDDDRGETENLIKQYPGKADELKVLLSGKTEEF